MRWIVTNLVTAFWACLFGLVMTYIASQLEQTSANYVVGAVLAVVVALVASNAITAISKKAIFKDRN